MYLEFEDFLFSCQYRGLSTKTIKSYRNTTKLFLSYAEEEFKIDEVKRILPSHIKAYLKEKSDSGCTNVYINTIIKVLRAFFLYCEQEEYIIKNPMSKIHFTRPEQKIIEIFTDREVANMLSIYDFSDYLNARNKTIMAVQFDTGVRTTETINILNNHIQDDRIFVQLGKGNKDRYVPVSFELRKILKRYEKIKQLYFKGKSIPDNYFLSRTGKPLTVEAIERIYRLAGEKAGVRDNVRCSPHTSRHYYSVKMLENNDIYTVSKLLGHSKINITQTYLSSLTNEKIIEQGQVSSPLSVIRGVRK